MRVTPRRLLLACNVHRARRTVRVALRFVLSSGSMPAYEWWRWLSRSSARRATSARFHDADVFGEAIRTVIQ